MRALLAVAQRDLRAMARERSIVAALVMQLLVAGFSAFLAVGLLGLYDPDSLAARPRTDVAYVGAGGFEARMAQVPNLEVANFSGSTTPDAQAAALRLAIEQFRSGDADALVQETLDPDGVHHISILVPKGSLEGTLLVTQLRALLQDYERDLRQDEQSRLDQPILDVEPTEDKALPLPFLYGTLLGLLVLTPVFLAGALASDGITGELERKTLLTLRSTPMRVETILAGKVLVPILLAPAQVLLWIGLLRLNGVVVHETLGLLLLTLAWAGLLCGAGLAIASRARRQGAAQAAYAFLVIALAPVSLALPRDPFNVIALLGSGRMDIAAWLTVAAWTALGAIALIVGLWRARRTLREA